MFLLILAASCAGFITGMLCIAIYRMADRRRGRKKRYSFGPGRIPDRAAPEADREILEKGRKDHSAGEYR